MKKILITLLAVFFSVAIFAQEETYEDVVVNKNGVAVLPEAGDFAIGIDASPFFNLIGNMIRLNDNTGPFVDPGSFDFVDGSSIYGKYFLSSDAAVRVRLDIMMMSQTLNNYVADDANTSDPNARVTDSYKYSSSGVNLGLGYELRRGKGRLQAFFGGELNLMLGGGYKEEYTYGNPMNDIINDPTTTIDFTTGASAQQSFRLMDLTVPGGFGFGLRGFVGVEYFVFPNISFGGEFGWGFMTNSVGDGEANTENWDFVDDVRNTTNTKVAGEKGFNLGNDNLGGNIYMMFHF